MHMRRVFAMALLWTLACSSGGAKSDAGSTPSDTCQAARACALDCSDAACLSACKARANADAQVAFQALVDCTLTIGQCANLSEYNCFCPAQCMMDPPCIAEVDACLAGTVQDNVCDMCF
jgi:hypothetical protein